MKCDELEKWDTSLFSPSAMVYGTFEVDEAIAELKAKLAEKDEEIDKQKWRGDEWAKACNQKDKEIESLKASHDAESVDTGMREHRLRRELWIVRAMRAHDKQHWVAYVEYVHYHEKSFYEFDGDDVFKRDNRNNDSFREWFRRWVTVERKCRAKAEKYK